MQKTVIRIPLLPLSLLALAFVGLLSCAVAWFVLMGHILSAPRKPTAEQTVPYNRHGETVYLTPLEEALLRTWLPAGGTVFGSAVFGFALWLRIAIARANAK